MVNYFFVYYNLCLVSCGNDVNYLSKAIHWCQAQFSN
jgi:hypothetical protein